MTGVNGGCAVLDAIIEGDTALVDSVDMGVAQWGEYWIPPAPLQWGPAHFDTLPRELKGATGDRCPGVILRCRSA